MLPPAPPSRIEVMDQFSAAQTGGATMVPPYLVAAHPPASATWPEPNPLGRMLWSVYGGLAVAGMVGAASFFALEFFTALILLPGAGIAGVGLSFRRVARQGVDPLSLGFTLLALMPPLALAMGLLWLGGGSSAPIMDRFMALATGIFLFGTPWHFVIAMFGAPRFLRPASVMAQVVQAVPMQDTAAAEQKTGISFWTILWWLWAVCFMIVVLFGKDLVERFG